MMKRLSKDKVIKALNSQVVLSINEGNCLIKNKQSIKHLIFLLKIKEKTVKIHGQISIAGMKWFPV